MPIEQFKWKDSLRKMDGQSTRRAILPRIRMQSLRLGSSNKSKFDNQSKEDIYQLLRTVKITGYGSPKNDEST